ncbi:S9 family peptidase (plasmid) [Streptomyces clavuligerus]|nr:S9 family peptidase [Streptomyces clavuligerus]MBY6306916.1 S9 family peptidase [Streptomyces clavuligerus]QCS10959.1 S9 family peptidase [Streptomyces clavuligerus]QPJ98449.1 prolyl oligopeptidase family serine peptidase [Streptomyces clavuligerus]QPL67400.1 S9 family peptidase [Streptomyces clavuligerus]
MSPALSPDGEHLAFLAPYDGVLNVYAGPWRSGEYRPVTADRGRGIRAFAWAGDGRHLLFVQDRDGDENTRLYAVPAGSGAPPAATPAPAPARDLTPYPGVQARIIALDPRTPGGLLIGLNLRERSVHDAYRLDIASGRLELAARNEGFSRWVADGGLRVRGAVRPRPDGGSTLLVRADESAPWRPLHETGPEDAVALRPVAFTSDGTRLHLLSSRGADTARLLSVDTTNGRYEVRYEDGEYDVDGVGLHPVTGAAEFVVVQRAHAETEILAPAAVAADFAALREAARGDVRVLGRDRSDRRWLVQHLVDDGPAGYRILERDGGGTRFLFSHLPALAGHRLARMEPFSFTARDGLRVHGYLTFPRGAARRGLPTVLCVHGGPWTRDVWGFRAEPQWLADRGYLCVQVNFRGSTGYGKRFSAAGDREWGGRMQDDLHDAVAHTVAAGYSDPGRVAVYGGSYGGYAALAGAAFTPGAFRCAVAVAGPSDLRTFIGSVPATWSTLGAQLRRRIGDPAVDGEFLWSRSPLSAYRDIRVPLLIGQGANDPRVRREESEQIVAALRRAGVPHEYLLFSDEGHGFVRPANRMAFYAAAERFLATHLGGRYEP